MKFNWVSKTLIFALTVSAAFLGQQKFRQYRLQKGIETEKNRLLNQLNELEGKSKQLEATFSYLDSYAYKELVARQQLNMQREGEAVFGFSEKEKAAPLSIEPPFKRRNIQKWMDYFLNRKDKNAKPQP